MSALARLGGWLKKYWYIPLLFLASLAAWLLFRRNNETPFEQTSAELKAIDAEAKAEKMEAVMGHQKAKEYVEEQYREELKQLDEKQTEQAKELRDDPAKLAKFLVRASRRTP
jgi:hypothetical protein